MKGQATIEYIVLLAVVLIIALVVFGLVGWVPELGGSLRERQSRTYWQSLWPLAIKDYKGSSSGLTLLIQNVADSKIEITKIYAEGDSTTISSYTLKPGESKQYEVTHAEVKCNTAGETFEYSNVSIEYDVSNGISGNLLSGSRPLIGTCTG